VGLWLRERGALQDPAPWAGFPEAIAYPRAQGEIAGPDHRLGGPWGSPPFPLAPAVSAVSNWFRKKLDTPTPGTQSRAWQAELASLEAEAQGGLRAFQGMSLNKAGDLCLRSGDRARALTYYGRAIDALLEDGQREAARGVANKIIRVHPGAVRTLCTLTWLDLAARHMATALLHLRDYVEAAQKAGQEHLTADQIRSMARVAPQGEFLAAAADALDQLGFTGWATEVRAWAQAGGSPEAIGDPEDLATRCLAAAVGANSSGASSS